MFKKVLALSAVMAAAPVMAETQAKESSKLYDFGSVSLNHIEWHDANSDIHDQLTFIEVETGAGYTWGDTYGFIDIEHNGHNISLSGKGQVAVKTAVDKLQMYSQVFHATDGSWYDTTLVAGAQYDASFSVLGKNITFKPFVGQMYSTGAYDAYQGASGQMAGYLLIVPVTDKFYISNWHETEFNRSNTYAEQQGGAVGHNGAVAGWYKFADTYEAGIQYRYARNKLGQNYENAPQSRNHGVIFTVKKTF